MDYRWGSDIQPLLACLDPRQPSPSAAPHTAFDVVLVSDCVYDNDAFAPLVASLCALCSTQHTLLFMSYEKRKKRELSFWRRLYCEFDWEQLPSSLLPISHRCPDIAVFAMRRRLCRCVGVEDVSNSDSSHGDHDHAVVASFVLADDGSDDERMGEFFLEYPHDDKYR